MEDRFASLDQRISDVAVDVRETRSTVQEIVKALQQLVRMEERQLAMSEKVDGLLKSSETMEKRLDDLERAEKLNALVRYVCGGAALAVLSWFGNKILTMFGGG